MSMLGRQSPDERDERLGGSRMSATANREQNIYIPQFITKRPFYAIDEADEGAADQVLRVGGAAADAAASAAAAAAASSSSGDGTSRASTAGQRDYLAHQRLRAKEAETGWYTRGRAAGPAATKYRKGACANCGSMGHAMRDCLQRPRARLAKHTGQDIAADEVVQDVRLGWDAKRDRWLGFAAEDYAGLVAQRGRQAEARRRLAGGSLPGGGDPGSASATAPTTSGTGPAASKGEGLDDTRYAEDADMGVSRTNGAADLRMREDTARYLVNLDPDSATYDPKRRKVVDGGAYRDASAALFAEQNFDRTAGDAAAMVRDERYAWEVHDQTGDASLHLQANPTAAAHRRRVADAAEAEKRAAMAALLQTKYGAGAADTGIVAAMTGATLEASTSTTLSSTLSSTSSKLPRPPKPLLASESFLEYDDDGHVKTRAARPDHSKYPEDLWPGNHTSVWGSWWHNFAWGYACCHALVRNSYCTGAAGRTALDRAERQRLGDWEDEADRPRKKLLMPVQQEEGDEDEKEREAEEERENKDGRDEDGRKRDGKNR